MHAQEGKVKLVVGYLSASCLWATIVCSFSCLDIFLVVLGPRATDLSYTDTPSQMTGFLCTKQELCVVLSNLLEPGQVLVGAPTATPTVV